MLRSKTGHVVILQYIYIYVIHLLIQQNSILSKEKNTKRIICIIGGVS